MKKSLPLRASLLALVLAFAASPFAPALSPVYDPLSTSRSALAQQTPEALETAYQTFKTGVETFPNNAELNFFYAATLLTREVHTAEFKQQFTSLNAAIVNPSIYALEYSFPLGFAGILQPPAGVRTDAHLAYLNSKSALIDEALASLDKITDGNFTLTLTSAETSLLGTKVDYADVCLLRAGLRLARASLHLANSYNVSGEYRKLYDLYAAGNLTPQAVLAAFPQLFNLSATPARRADARTQIQLAHAEWNNALAAIQTKRPASEGSILGPIGENDTTPFLFAFDSIAAAEEVDVMFDALVTSLSSQVTFPTFATEDFDLEGSNINLSSLVSSPSPPRSLAPTRFDRGFFRPNTWPDPTLGGIFPGATQDDANDAGNFVFVLQPTVYEPYQFWLLAGTPDEPGYFEDSQVLFNQINGIAVDANGNIYVADQGNHLIRKISIDNKVTTIAGQIYDGRGTDYQPDLLEWNIGPITVTQNGTVYFRNGSLLSKITPDGKLSNLAGSFSWSPDPKDGFGADAILDGDYRWGQTMAADKNGNIYLCDTNAIRKVSPAGQVTTLAGKLGWDESEGHVDGTGTIARFNNPTGIAVDDAGVIYVMDSGNFVIRKLQPDGTTSTFVGNATISNHFDSKGTKARLNRPEGLAIDSIGNLYFRDSGTIRKVKPDGTVTTLAGKLKPDHTASRIGDQMGIQEAAGEAAVFGEDDVTGLAVDRRGTLYASFENSIYEAESIAAPPSGTPFPSPTPLSTPGPKPTPAPTPVSTPELLSLTLATTSVDLTSGAVDLPFRAITSSLMRNLNLNFSHSEASPSIHGYAYGHSIRSSGLLEIPAYAKAGLWSLTRVSYTDSTSYNWIELNASQIAALGEVTFTLSNAAIDNTSPVVHSITLLSTEANASASSAKIRYRIQISDDLSGFSSLNVKFKNENAYEYLYDWDVYDWNSLVSVDGNLKTYEGAIEIPQGTTGGDWILQSIWVSDQAGNNGSVTLTPAFQDVKFQVSSMATNASDPQDQYAPWPIALTLDKASVDVSNADQKVKVQITINNDELPMNEPRISIHLNNIDGYRESIIVSDFQLVSGTVAQGIYEGELVIPKYTQNGNFTVSEISIDEQNPTGDGKSYQRWVDSIPADLRKTISVTGTQDVTAPVLQSIAVLPSSADTRNGTILVTANLTITDDLSGLQEAEYFRGGALALRSPSGKEFLWSGFTSDDRISGNSTNGIYQVQFDLPQYSEEGAWTIDYIELIDRNYNTRFLIPANLTAQQLAASTIQVQGWPRGWETFSSNQQNTANQAKVVITKQSAKFWFPIENIDGNWTWGTGEGGYSFQGDYLEYDWSVEILRNPKYWLSFTHLKKPKETVQSGNFTEFLAAGQVNVWEDSADGGTIIESASISASRNGTCLLIELTDSAVLSKLQKAMPSYVPFLSFDPSSGSYDNQNVKVEYVKEDVQLSLGNLTHTADGTDKMPSVTSTPGNHTQDVTITYNGTTSPPSEPGTYTVVAFLNAANYKGRQVATMTISKPTQTIAAFSAISDKVFGAAPFVVTAPTSSSNLPVVLSVKSGPASVSGNTLTLTGAGTVVLAANQAGNANYNAAPEVTTSFNVTTLPPPAPPAPAPAPQAPAASNKGKKPAASKSKAGAAAKKPAASKSKAGAAAKKPTAKKAKKK